MKRRKAIRRAKKPEVKDGPVTVPGDKPLVQGLHPKISRALTKLPKPKREKKLAPLEVAGLPCRLAAHVKRSDAGILTIVIRDTEADKQVTTVSIGTTGLLALLGGKEAEGVAHYYNLNSLGCRRETVTYQVGGLKQMKVGEFRRWYRRTVLPLEVDGWRITRKGRVDLAKALVRRSAKRKDVSPVKISVPVVLVRLVPTERIIERVPARKGTKRVIKKRKATQATVEEAVA
jgi:hypothetical protein